MKTIRATTFSALLSAILSFAACKKDPVIKQVENKPPVANAGPDLIIRFPKDSVVLDGTKSTDPENNIWAYAWKQLSGPESRSISAKNSATVSVSQLVLGIYQFELTVVDDKYLSSRDTVQVTVLADSTSNNRPPAVSLGSDVRIEIPKNWVTIYPSASDPDGNIKYAQWKKISGPDVYKINNLSYNYFKDSARLSGLSLGNYVFEYSVMDTYGMTGKDTIAVSVVSNLQSYEIDLPFPASQSSITLHPDVIAKLKYVYINSKYSWGWEKVDNGPDPNVNYDWGGYYYQLTTGGIIISPLNTGEDIILRIYF